MPLNVDTAHRKDINTGLSEMQHRHFATIATIIRAMPHAQRRNVAEHFADYLNRTNERFDRKRFLAACES